MRNGWRWCVVAWLAFAATAQAVQAEIECKTNGAGQQVCTQTSTPTPAPPPREIDEIPVVGTSAPPESFNRYVWELLNRQTTSWVPDVHDIGSVGAEGKGGTEEDCSAGAVGTR